MVSDDDEENLMKYIKPASEYKLLEKRSKNSPYFLRRCLNYIIKAKKKRRSNSGATIVFNYRNSRNDKTLKVEVVKKSSCPFCLMLCGGMEGLRLHLISSHDVFNYVFYEEDHGPEIDVYLKADAFRFGVQKLDSENNPWIPFTFCSKRPRPRKRDNSNNMKRINLRLLELDINEAPHDTETELTHVNDDSVSSPPRAHSLEKTSEVLTTTQLEIAQSSAPEVPHVSRRKKLLTVAEQPTAIEIERLKNRQFYHSKSMQPMTFEQVMTGEDSENEDDHDALDINERMRLERYVGVSKEAKRYMYLWNIFVRRQRVIVDAHVPWLCEEFSKLHKEELKGHSFNWWWRLFLIKLWDYGLVCAKTINKCNTIIQNSDEAGPSTSQGAANANTQDFMEID